MNFGGEECHPHGEEDREQEYMDNRYMVERFFAELTAFRFKGMYFLTALERDFVPKDKFAESFLHGQ